jgi:hypothetical protein
VEEANRKVRSTELITCDTADTTLAQKLPEAKPSLSSDILHGPWSVRGRETKEPPTGMHISKKYVCYMKSVW